MRYAIVESGKVVNVAVADSAIANGWIRSDTAQIGDLYDGKKFTTPKPDTVEGWKQVRDLRDKLLSGCDWTMISDTPTNKTAWSAYRQALRDLPQNNTDPYAVNWPVAPSN